MFDSDTIILLISEYVVGYFCFQFLKMCQPFDLSTCKVHKIQIRVENDGGMLKFVEKKGRVCMPRDAILIK